MTVDLKGYISNNSGGGLADVTVEAWKPGDLTASSSTYTDSDGMWYFNNLTDSPYIVKAIIGNIVKKIDGRSKLQLASLQIREKLHMLVPITSDVTTGTAPFVVASTTRVSNLNADMIDGYHAGTAAGQLMPLDASAWVPLANIPGNLTGKSADMVDGCDAGTSANQVLKLSASGLVPLGNIPSTLTGKDADTVDGAHAGTAANQVLKLDGTGRVPLAVFPGTLTGISADMLDGYHGSAFSLSGHTHAGSEITGTVSNADMVDGRHAGSSGGMIPILDDLGLLSLDHIPQTLTDISADKVDGYHAGTGPSSVLLLDNNGLVPLGNIPGTLAYKDADTVDSYHAGNAAGKLPILDGSAWLPLAQIPPNLTGKDADTVDGCHAGTVANQVLKLSGTGLVPLANIPTVLTGKDADTVDGCDAGTSANQVLKLDGTGRVPLDVIPATLTGKDADTVDNYHASSFSLVGHTHAATEFIGTIVDADMVDGHHAGTAANMVPVLDGSAWLPLQHIPPTLTNKSADMLDGYHSTAFAYASHTHQGTDIISVVGTAMLADTVDGYHAGVSANQVLVLNSSGLVPLTNIPSTLTGKDADTVDGYHAGIAPGKLLVLDASTLVPLAQIPATLTGKDADTVDGAHAGTASNQVLKLDSLGYVPLANIPSVLTGKDADTVDGYHAGTAASQVLRLDPSGFVPLANIPGTLTGKDADTLDGNHASAFAVAAKGVTNGDSHDHNGGDGAQISHLNLLDIGTNSHATIDSFISSKGAANGLADLDSSSLLPLSRLPGTLTGKSADMCDGYHAGTAAGQLLVLSTSGYVPLGNIPATLTGKDADTVDGYHASAFAPIGQGVTNGNSHDHNGGDGAQIAHSSLSGIGTNTHDTIDSFIASKGAASGLASLDTNTTVPLSQIPATLTGKSADMLDGYHASDLCPVGVVNIFAGATAPSGWLLCDGSAVSRTTYAALFAVISTTYGAGDGSTTFNLPNLKGRVPVGRDASQAEFDVLGETGGEKAHALSEAELAAHTHGIGGSTGGQSSNHVHSVDTQGGHAHTAGSAGAHTHTTSNVMGPHLSGYDHASAGTTGSFQTLTTSSSGAHTHTTDTQGGHIHNLGGTSADHTHTLPSATTSTGSGSAHQNLQPYITMNYIIKY